MESKTKKNSQFLITGLRIFWNLVGDQKKNLLLVIMLILLIEVSTLLTPYFMKIVVDSLPSVLESGYSDRFILFLALALLISPLGSIVRNLVKDRIYYKSLISLENYWPVMLQKKLLELHQGYHEKESTGSKAAKITKGCDKMVHLFDRLINDMIPKLFFLIVNFFLMLTISPLLTLIFFLPFVPLAYYLKNVYDRRAETWKEWTKKHELSQGLLTQSILNVPTVQSFVQESNEQKRMRKVRSEMYDIDVAVTIRMNKERCFIENVLHLFYGLTLFAGVAMYINGSITIGTLVYVIATSGGSMYCLQDVVGNYSNLIKELVSVYRMQKILDAEIKVTDIQSPLCLEDGLDIETLRFENVLFKYNENADDNILKGLDLNIEPGEMTAIVGPSGSGKSTIISLLARKYDPTSGSIKLNGNCITNINRDQYRNIFSTVSQQVGIFDGTLSFNVRYGNPESTDLEVEEALRASSLGEMLDNPDRFPLGLETEVGERGIKLSGGEQQRLGIARAYLSIMKGAKVLILDEATSSLDPVSEKVIQDMILNLREKKSISIVAIAHRLATIKDADKICVISDGVLCEQGNHKELVNMGGLYSDFVKKQNLAA